MFDGNLAAAVLERADGAPDVVALIGGESGEAITYGELARQVRGVSAALRGLGHGPGDVAAIWMPNTPAWVTTALGAMHAGLAVSGVSPAAVEREVTHQLEDSGATILVTFPPFADRARAAAAGTAVRDVVLASDLAAEPDGAAPAPGGEALALLPYSSGTTGLPKGVELTHRNLAAGLAAAVTTGIAGRGDVLLALAPFPHIMGALLTLALPLTQGATVVTLAKVELERFFGLIDAHRVSVLVVPPPLMGALAFHPLSRAHDLSSVQLIACGGAPLAPALQAAVAERLPGAAIGQGYGLTETTACISVPSRAGGGSRPGTVGRLVPDTEIRVVDPQTGAEVSPGEPGELVVRGPQVMRGYRNRQQETAAVLDRDGWLRTGDLGSIAPDGTVTIHERLKELIKVNAYQVAPAELEALLAQHPAVADAAVIGRPDERRGEVPIAFVVTRAEVDPGALAAWMAQRTAPYKHLAEVVLVDELPRTPSGKLLRRVLRDRLAEPAPA